MAQKAEAKACTFVPASSPAVASLKRKYAVTKAQSGGPKIVELPEHDAEVHATIDLESHSALASSGKVTSMHEDVSIPTEEVEDKVVNPANLADEHPNSLTNIHESFSTNTAVNQTTLLNFVQAETTSSSEQSTLRLVLDAISGLSSKVDNISQRHSTLERLACEDNEVRRSVELMRKAGNIIELTKDTEYLEWFYDETTE